MTGSHHSPLTIAGTRAALDEVVTNTAAWAANLNPDSPVVIRVDRDHFHLASLSAAFIDGRWLLVLNAYAAHLRDAR